MKYVLDASVAVKWVLPEPDSPKATALRDDFHRAIHELLSPDTFTAEVAHALLKAERRKLIPHGDALLNLAKILKSLPQLHPILPDLLPQAAAIASQARIGVYDCLYVALAERETCQLVTADTRLISVIGKQYPFIVPLSSLP
jgi:predicted nucleic acid-binding protein